MAAVSGAGCVTEVRESPPPICTLARPDTEEARLRAPDNEELVHLILGASAEVGSPSPDSDCSGTSTRSASTECDGERSSLPSIRLTDAEIITRRLDDTQQIVWIVTHSDGVEGEGPVAIVERRERGLVSRAQGVLRADLGRPRFRFAADDRVLIMESERCSDPEDPSTCERSANLLVRAGNRLEREPLVHEESGACIAPPTLALTRVVTRALPNGWQRRFALSASWEDASGGLVVHESVSVTDWDPRAPSIPPRPFRDVSTDRTVTVGGGLHGNIGPLLERTLIELGSVALPEGDAS